MDQIALIRDSFVCGVRVWWSFAGDPLVSGSLFMAAYAVTAWLMLRVANRSTGMEKAYWRLCGGLFLFQLINVNADLQGLAYTVGACLAHAQGWYEHRQPFQYELLIVLLVAGSVLGLILVAIFFRNIIGNLLLTLGMAVLAALLISEAVSYHWFDHFYSLQYGPFSTKQLIEMSGILLVFLASIIRLSSGSRHRLADAPQA